LQAKYSALIPNYKKGKTFSWHCEHQNHACLHAEMPSLAEMIRAGRRGHGTFNMNLSKE
jgi:hypothetical protein